MVFGSDCSLPRTPALYRPVTGVAAPQVALKQLCVARSRWNGRPFPSRGVRSAVRIHVGPRFSSVSLRGG